MAKAKMAQQDTSTLAQGCFGKVYKVKYGDQWACVKRVPVDCISETDLVREYKVYRKAKHANVVRLLGDPWVKDLKWNIPLEFISGEELETTIFYPHKSKIKLNRFVQASIISGMCAGLTYLHSKDIVHQDIKPDNIMVEHETHRAIIIDLGLAKFFRDGISSARNLGNLAYSAPEILQQHAVRDQRSDVWAMGKVIAELCIGERLLTHTVTPSNIQSILSGNPYRRAVSKMVDSNPATRASMMTVSDKILRAIDEILRELLKRIVPVLDCDCLNHVRCCCKIQHKHTP
ncbi:mitogen-activated protein kinase HOG1-like isoform X1 [Alosa sapidissima]|uniref:mitogen-activated protein kinase HOG1-like isoform X1 n=2 Tax=Alosa sapidissima TaxID=34773 RepID=UPI001C089133|nr:mitogen-activated protein kinase HOG1-like isoform X1 [Alosa sapidissima]